MNYWTIILAKIPLIILLWIEACLWWEFLSIFEFYFIFNKCLAYMLLEWNTYAVLILFSMAAKIIIKAALAVAASKWALHNFIEFFSAGSWLGALAGSRVYFYNFRKQLMKSWALSWQYSGSTNLPKGVDLHRLKYLRCSLHYRLPLMLSTKRVSLALVD